MLDSRLNTIDTNSRRTEEPKCFHFAITWSSLTSQLLLSEASNRNHSVNVRSSELAPAKQTVPLLAQTPEPESNARWEMVVPKMVRTGRRTFASVNSPPNSEAAAKAIASYPSPPFANFTAQPFLSRAFSVIGRRTRALLASPVPSVVSGVPMLLPREQRGPNVFEGSAAAAREVFLSKLAKALRSSPPVGSMLSANRSPETRSEVTK